MAEGAIERMLLLGPADLGQWEHIKKKAPGVYRPLPQDMLKTASPDTEGTLIEFLMQGRQFGVRRG